MTDPAQTDAAGSPPPEPDRTPAAEPAGPAAPVAGADSSTAEPALERRAFVRRMGTDAVRTAGTVFSFTRILTRSAAAAGQAVMTELESLQVGNAAEEVTLLPAGDGTAAPAEVAPAPEVVGPEAAAAGVAPEAAAEVPAPHPAALLAPEAPAPATATSSFTKAPAPAPARLVIDADQRALLEAATSAVVAVNREGHPPQLTAATVLWDGETVRFATLGWARRTTMLRTDPRIGLLVEGPGDGRFVTVSGRARIVEGREARDATWPLLLREAGAGGEAAAEARWQELVAADLDRAVIVVEPEQVLSGRR